MGPDNQKRPEEDLRQVGQNKKWYRNKMLWSGAVLVAFAGIFACLYIFSVKQKTSGVPSLISITPSASDPTSTYPVPKEWKEYHNDIFGLSFSYSPEWGNIEIWPGGSITNLKTLGKDDNLSADYMGYIRLSLGSGPFIKMYSSEYGGEKYSSPPYGPIDNLMDLRPSDTACNYKIDYHQKDSLKEIFTDCLDGIKIVLTEQLQRFGPPTGDLYTYSLDYYGYTHLQNGSFDYLLTSYNVARTRQQTKRLTATEYLNQEGIVDRNYPKFDEFAAFFHNLKAYSPPTTPSPTFYVPKGEDPNVTTVRKYYFLLTTGKLADAYQLLSNPPFSLPDFQASNQSIYRIEPYDFKHLAGNKYEFWLNYQEQNRESEQQRAIVEITNGKIKQDLQESLLSSIVKFDNMIAYGAIRGDKNILLLKQNDKEIIVDSAEKDSDTTFYSESFTDPVFSPKGNYLKYTVRGWEWATSVVYDIADNKEVLKTTDGHGEFNTTETIYFFCDNSGMGSDYTASIYTVPAFKLKLDLLKQFPDLNYYEDVECNADQQKHSLQFKFTGKSDKYYSNLDAKALKIYNFNLDTGDLVD